MKSKFLVVFQILLEKQTEEFRLEEVCRKFVSGKKTLKPVVAKLEVRAP